MQVIVKGLILSLKNGPSPKESNGPSSSISNI